MFTQGGSSSSSALQARSSSTKDRLRCQLEMMQQAAAAEEHEAAEVERLVQGNNISVGAAQLYDSPLSAYTTSLSNVNTEETKLLRDKQQQVKNLTTANELLDFSLKELDTNLESFPPAFSSSEETAERMKLHAELVQSKLQKFDGEGAPALRCHLTCLTLLQRCTKRPRLSRERSTAPCKPSWTPPAEQPPLW